MSFRLGSGLSSLDLASSSASLQLLREALGSWTFPEHRPSVSMHQRHLEPRTKPPSSEDVQPGASIWTGTQETTEPRLDPTIPMERTNVQVERLKAELQRMEEELEAQRKSEERLRKEKEEVEERVEHLSRQVGEAWMEKRKEVKFTSEQEMK